MAIVQVILKTLSVEYSGNIIKSLYDPLIYLSIFLLVAGLALWFISASQIEFSVLIPASLITIVISSIIGLFIFSEEISLRKIIAYVLIVIGIITLTYSKSSLVGFGSPFTFVIISLFFVHFESSLKMQIISCVHCI